MARILKWVCLSFAGLGLGYFSSLAFPQPLFAYSRSFENLTLFCDDPIPLQAGAVLQDAQARLEKCPLYSGHPHQNIFICDHSWRHKLLTNHFSGSGGLAYAFASWNVFLRKSDIAGNIVFRRDGVTPSGPDRPLSYFIAHEITHNMTSRFLGIWAFLRLPAWKTEGYADYVGKGGDFDFKKNLALFKKADPLLDPHASGLYLRYHLLVAELLDRRKWTVQRMLTESVDRKELEKEIIAD